MGIFLRNWHLKLGAVFLATVLYTGLVFSGSFTEQVVTGVPIEMVGQPDDWVPLTQLETIEVRYRVAADSAQLVFPESFSATVEFDDYDQAQAGQPQALPVSVRPLLDGITVLSVTPNEATVALDEVTTRTVPVRVERGSIPDGLEIGEPQASVDEVAVRGASSLLNRIDHAEARVSIDPSGINIDDQVDLVPVDVNGEPVQGRIELTPATATVSIDVQRVETRKTVPVTPVLSGTPAPGYSLTSITVDPPVVTLIGLQADLAGINEVTTESISVDGATEGVSGDVALVMPDGARLGDSVADSVSVQVGVEATDATRTFAVGVTCTGAAEGSSCLPSQGQVAVILSGPVATLNAIAAADLAVTVDVTGLGPGQHAVAPTVTLPPGTQLEGISPGSVSVTIAPPQTPAPTPAP
jgi:YbbR domain-containing protein